MSENDSSGKVDSKVGVVAFCEYAQCATVVFVTGPVRRIAGSHVGGTHCPECGRYGRLKDVE